MKRRRVDGMVGEATGASQAGAAHRSGLGKTQDRMAWPAWVDAWAQPSSTEKSSSVLEKGISPRPHRKPHRAPSQTPHRMARRPGMEAMEPPRSKRAAGEDQASAVESGDYITGGSYSPHRGVAGEPGCRYALDLPRHEGSNR